MNVENETVFTAEQSVIGSIIIDGKSLAKVIDVIKAEDFYFSKFKEIYIAILSLFSQGKAIDFVTVLNQVVNNNDVNLDESQTKQLLFDCTQVTLTSRNIEYYAKIVVDASKARKLKEIGTNLAFDKVNFENVTDIANKTISELYDIVFEENDKKLQDISSIGLQVLENYKSSEKDMENRSQTGYSKLDGILKDMSAGNLIVLAARPKIGKTAFALSIAKNVALSGKNVVFYSLEMENSEIYERLLSNISSMPMSRLIRNKCSYQEKAEEIIRLEKATEKLKNLKIKVNDKADISVNEIRAQCKMIENLGLIVIDYLQLMKSNKKHDNRNQEIGAISRELKILASELKVPILCLSQLNRTSSEEKRPTPCDLRDSGEIEQNCSKLILMWCVEKHFNELGSISSKTIGVDVSLNRRGNTGVVLMNFNGEYMCFTELEKKYEEKERNQERVMKWR